MTLLRVTISGADDATDPDELIALSGKYPFVEWGILFSAKREGSARYPSRQWVTRLLASPNASVLKLSAHLCGSAARETMGGSVQWLSTIGPQFQRVQLNGFDVGVDERLLGLIEDEQRFEFILQVRDSVSLATACQVVGATHQRGGRVSALWDQSGGKGLTVPTHSWPFSPVYERAGGKVHFQLGFAGGLTRHNIVSAAKSAALRPDDTWLDLETGARNSADQWDPPEVFAILQEVRPYVGPPEPCPNHRYVMLLPFEGCAVCANST